MEVERSSNGLVSRGLMTTEDNIENTVFILFLSLCSIT